MSKVYLIGDTHWGHKSICKYRPQFSSPEEHDNVLFENIMSTIGKRDVLWLLGDICFDTDKFHYLKQLNEYCQKVNFIIGNHDTQNKDRQRVLGMAMLEGIPLHSLVSYKGTWLSHHPVHPYESRGKVNLHGHVHSATIEQSGYFNCSAENLGFFPREFGEIKKACLENDWYKWNERATQ